MKTYELWRGWRSVVVGFCDPDGRGWGLYSDMGHLMGHTLITSQRRLLERELTPDGCYRCFAWWCDGSYCPPDLQHVHAGPADKDCPACRVHSQIDNKHGLPVRSKHVVIDERAEPVKDDFPEEWF